LIALHILLIKKQDIESASLLYSILEKTWKEDLFLQHDPIFTAILTEASEILNQPFPIDISKFICTIKRELSPIENTVLELMKIELEKDIQLNFVEIVKLLRYIMFRQTLNMEEIYFSKVLLEYLSSRFTLILRDLIIDDYTINYYAYITRKRWLLFLRIIAKLIIYTLIYGIIQWLENLLGTLTALLPQMRINLLFIQLSMFAIVITILFMVIDFISNEPEKLCLEIIKRVNIRIYKWIDNMSKEFRIYKEHLPRMNKILLKFKKINEDKSLEL